MRHSGRSLEKPVLLRDSSIISLRRINQYSRPKIIVAKLGKRFEAVFDEHGEYAAFNVNFILEDGDAGYYYVGLLNSKVSSWTYRQVFGALRMGGDYLQFQSPQLKSMPVVPYNTECDIHRNVAALARRASLDSSETALRRAIDVRVSRIYGLTDEDLNVISQDLQAFDPDGG